MVLFPIPCRLRLPSWSSREWSKNQSSRNTKRRVNAGVNGGKSEPGGSIRRPINCTRWAGYPEIGGGSKDVTVPVGRPAHDAGNDPKGGATHETHTHSGSGRCAFTRCVRSSSTDTGKAREESRIAPNRTERAEAQGVSVPSLREAVSLLQRPRDKDHRSLCRGSLVGSRRYRQGTAGRSLRVRLQRVRGQRLLERVGSVPVPRLDVEQHLLAVPGVGKALVPS